MSIDAENTPIKKLIRMRRAIELLPNIALQQPITHYDLLSLLELLEDLFSTDKDAPGRCD